MAEIKDMTVAEAQAIAMGRLQMGNEQHIHAVRLVNLFDELHCEMAGPVTVKCKGCGGRGEVICDYGCEHECKVCDGKRRVKVEMRIKEMQALTLAKVSALLAEIRGDA